MDSKKDVEISETGVNAPFDVTKAGQNTTITIRNVNETDLPFIYSSFLRSIYYSNKYFNKVPAKLFFEKYKIVVNHILNRPFVIIKIVCLEDMPDIVLGYAIAEEHVLHYVYVKEAWRTQRLSALLVSTLMEIKEVSHLTTIGDVIRLKKGWVYNPFTV